MTDQGLIDALRQDLHGNFHLVLSEFQDRIYSTALRIARDPEDALEATQQTLIDIWRNFDRFEGKSKLSTWVYRVAVNRTLMVLRSRKRDNRGEELEAAAEVPDDCDPLAMVDSARLARLIEREIGNLRDVERTVMTLRYLNGLSNSETAEICGLSVPGVKSILFRGRNYLRSKLGEARKQAVG